MHWAETILTGVASSGVFLLIISQFKPKIHISKNVAASYEKLDGKDKQVYSFKIINKSWFFKAYDIKIRAYICEVIPSANADDISYNEIELRKTDQWVLPKLLVTHIWQDLLCGDNRLNSRTDYAAQFSTFHNLKNSLSQKKFITFEIIAKHSLTGFSVVKTRSYKHINEIVKGNFLSGNSFKIKEVQVIDPE